MTLLQAVNAVLRRLREGVVTTVSASDYSTLIVDLINQSKREVEDSWNWTALRTVIPVTCTSSQGYSTVTGAGERYRILSVFNNSEETQMHRVSQHFIDTQNNISNTQNSNPIYYNIKGTSSGDPVVYWWPIPDAADVINFNIVVPQDDLSADADVITVPSWPVILGAYAKAVSERGEDGGLAYAEAISEFNKALSDAIAIDAVNASQELDWRVC